LLVPSGLCRRSCHGDQTHKAAVSWEVVASEVEGTPRERMPKFDEAPDLIHDAAFCGGRSSQSAKEGWG